MKSYSTGKGSPCERSEKYPADVWRSPDSHSAGGVRRGCTYPDGDDHPLADEHPAIATGTSERTEHSLLIPVGRTAVVGSNAFRVMIDSEPFDPAPVYDGYGGYWIEVPYDDR